jgi:hypothetical protein
MALDPVRLAEHVHGHLGWLAAAVLAHPAIVLRDRARRAHLAVGLAAGLPTLTAAIGVALYGPYREKLKQGIFLASPRVGWLFERKEHLAFGAVLLAWAGAGAYVGARHATARETRGLLRTIAHRAFVASALAAACVAALGTIVASFRSF